jgi:alpha-L-fucosidase 2
MKNCSISQKSSTERISFDLSVVALSVSMLFALSVHSAELMEKQMLWSDSPVVIPPKLLQSLRGCDNYWAEHVYPLGNGRLGCTVFGDPMVERIQFNEDSLWVGNEDCTGGYQPFGDVYVEFGHKDFTNYHRALDISRAVQSVSYTAGGVNYTREYFASHPAQAMIYRFSADKKGALSGNVRLDTLHLSAMSRSQLKNSQAEKEITLSASNNTLTLKGNTDALFFWQLHLQQPERIRGAREYASDKNITLDFEAQVRVLHEGGTVKTVDNKVVFEQCDSLTLILVADTNYLNQRKAGWRTTHPHQRISAQLEAAEKKPYKELLSEHVADYQKLYGRFSLRLGTVNTQTINKTTAERIKQYKPGTDPDLESLIYQYARYLMISCSRPGHGALPANLQGLWLFTVRPAWRCDYHTDVNLQMNYWFVDQANLSECFTPLAEWLDSIREVRKEETLKVLGVKRGWLMRSENGVFGGSTYFFQKGDSAWISQNLWDHYAFTQDKEYLKRYAYPMMKEISEFWLDHLKPLPDGRLVVPDGRSPEQGPEKSDGVAYDQQLCWDLFNNVIEASAALGMDAEYRQELIAKRDKLEAPKIGKWGQLQEWQADLDDPKNQHRHISHLIGVFPGRQIHPTITPEWAAAAKISLQARGAGPTGWSKIFRGLLSARLLDPETAYQRLSEVINEKTHGNLWMTHPPFQIDANFGYAALVNEMLLESHLGVLRLLPALPKAWSDGKVMGLRARGGYEVDMEWKSGSLVHAVIRNVSSATGECTVRYGDRSQKMIIPCGETKDFNGK